jgi:hypothetical protein
MAVEFGEQESSCLLMILIHDSDHLRKIRDIFDDLLQLGGCMSSTP